MDYKTFCIVVASLQSAAVHLMTPHEFTLFNNSIKAMRDARETPHYIVNSLTSQLSDKTKELART